MAKRKSRRANLYRALAGCGCVIAGGVLLVLNFSPMFLIALLLVALGSFLLWPLVE
ncbi:MAG: hypothetical protein R6U37_04100 [Dehalococcoidia bacterium]